MMRKEEKEGEEEGKEEEEGRGMPVSLQPELLSSSLFLEPAAGPANSCALSISVTAAFSWGEIKRLGGVGTCWPQEPKQCLI